MAEKRSELALDGCSSRSGTQGGGGTGRGRTSEGMAKGAVRRFLAPQQILVGRYGSCRCVACPVVWTTSSTGAPAKTACNTCVDGYISQNGECVRNCDASANEIWSAEAQSCVCVDGSYSDAGMCITCPAGSCCADGVQTQCPAGRYSAAGAKECVPCESGAISSAGATECTICEAGTYANATATECTSCQTGTTSDAGSDEEIDCNRCADDYISYNIEDLTAAKTILSTQDYDDYDRLIQLCDMFFEGMYKVSYETRIEGICKRYNLKEEHVRSIKKGAIINKEYFDNLCGCNIYDLLNIRY